MNQQSTLSPLNDQSRSLQVSENALVKRINRKLRPDMEQLKRTRNQWQLRFDLGHYYVQNHTMNIPSQTHVNIEELGREMGVLHENEKLVWDDED